MTSSSLPALLAISVVPGCLVACAHSGRPSPDPPSGSMVTSEDIERNPGEPIEKVLMRRFPGVMVVRTADGGISVRIRGVTSFQGSNEPLYVVDDVPIQPGAVGGVAWINPYDIESIEVLKDPVDTALYGVRGANGVIVIKTKRPGR